MAAHAHSITQPITDLPTPRKEVEDALYEANVITDIISKLGALMISDSQQVCGTSFDWLAEQLTKRLDTVQKFWSALSGGEADHGP